ncbi:MAG: ABC-F family ATP-binding cassette domain-containing protein [Flavobacteriales bacterium]|nr:ABC-F family ATP-binding cassette domain-containing protein [Flavobacteriales bacterium]
MNCISVESLAKSYHEKWLFTNLSLGVNQGEKIALIGRNGIGKSTLLRIIAKGEEPDKGEVVHNKLVKVVYLPQEPFIEPAKTVWEVIFDGTNPLANLVSRFEMAQSDPQFDPDELAEIMEEMDLFKAWDYENMVRETLARLGITDFKQMADRLSGGQKRRLAIASMILKQPDVYILDEPTNHLDIEAIEWLEGLLSSKNITLIMVSHDRYFIDRVCNKIVELDQDTIYTYKGNYNYFLEKKSERLQIAATEQQKARQLMLKELEWMRRQPQARGTKSKSRIESFYELKDKADKRFDENKLELTVKAGRQGSKILELNHIVHGYGETNLINDFSYVFKTGEKIGIIGKNGAGKSTLIDIITGRLKPRKGNVVVGQTTGFGYFSQNSAPLNPEHRLLDDIREVADNILLENGKTITAARFLEKFLFRKEQHFTPLGKLSGGEKRRLQLIKILMTSPNFLILDEPTNDFDIDTLNVLEDFLENFQGNVLVVSHDRYFIDKICDHVFAFEEDGRIKDFPGNYTDYRNLKADQNKAETLKAKIDRDKNNVNQKEKSKEKVKLSFKEKHELETLTKDIENLETEKNRLVEQLQNASEDYTLISEISERMQEVTQQLDEKEFRWLELSELENS